MDGISDVYGQPPFCLPNLTISLSPVLGVRKRYFFSRERRAMYFLCTESFIYVLYSSREACIHM